jgi:hypothetical protein
MAFYMWDTPRSDITSNSFEIKETKEYDPIHICRLISALENIANSKSLDSARKTAREALWEYDKHNEEAKAVHKHRVNKWEYLEDIPF